MATFECGACGYAASGYTRKELLEQGWTFHATKSGDFPLCDCCTDEYKRRRAEAAQALA